MRAHQRPRARGIKGDGAGLDDSRCAGGGSRDGGFGRRGGYHLNLGAIQIGPVGDRWVIDLNMDAKCARVCEHVRGCVVGSIYLAVAKGPTELQGAEWRGALDARGVLREFDRLAGDVLQGEDANGLIR